MSSPDTPDERLARAALSLEGLSVGDAFGEQFFVDPYMVNDLIEARTLPAPEWYFTDDTQMALSVVSILRQYRKINPDILAMSFGARYDARRGYGGAMHWLLPKLWQGGKWPDLAPLLFDGQGSYGNGGAMRVAPVGAYFADDIDAVVENAARSSEVTHAHPEATAGAISVAVAAAYAWRLRDNPPDRQQFLDLILPHVPDSIVREKIRHARRLDPSASVILAMSALGSGHDISAQDTCPFALWCAGGHLDNYEEALWLTVSGLGDRDTTCAMVGGIVALSAGAASIPETWIAAREPLPTWPFDEQTQF
jgi:ADP-ribosylglycohydrolase